MEASQLFFFQAEDGIRDYKVTGVQTCALPICLILKARQIPDLSFIHLVHLVHPSSAARTGHAAIPPLALDPQLELLVLFVDLLLIDPIARESQHLRPVVLHDQPSLVATLLPPHLAQTSHFCVVHPWPSG